MENEIHNLLVTKIKNNYQIYEKDEDLKRGPRIAEFETIEETKKFIKQYREDYEIENVVYV